MQRTGLRLMPLVALMAVGCSGPVKQAARKPALHRGPQYGWLRKQGPVDQTREAFLQAKEAAPLQAWEPISPVPGTAIDVQASAGPSGPAVEHRPMARPLPTGQQEVATPLPTAADGTDYYGDEERLWSVKGIVSAPIGAGAVVSGILLHNIWILIIGGAIALALGLIASRQCRDRSDRGKAFALVGMILGAFSLFFGLMVLIWAGA